MKKKNRRDFSNTVRCTKDMVATYRADFYSLAPAIIRQYDYGSTEISNEMKIIIVESARKTDLATLRYVKKSSN